MLSFSSYFLFPTNESI